MRISLCLCDMATVEDEVFGSLGLLKLDELLYIYGILALPDLTEDQKVVAILRKRIRKHLSSDTIQESEDEGLAYFLQIKNYLDTQDIRVSRNGEGEADQTAGGGGGTTTGAAGPTSGGDAGTGGGVTSPAVQIGRFSVKQEVKKEAKEVKKEELDNSVSTAISPADLKRYLRKDFKIKGTIRAPGQKDGIKFSTLAREINTGIRKGHSEEDICDEVIRICSPDIELGELLESDPSLTLPKLRKILRVHFHEPDSSKLFSDLCKTRQSADQRPTDFVQHLINLSQRILFVSKEAGCIVQFNEPTVRTQLVATLMSGMKNNNIRNELKPLVHAGMSNDELLELVDKALSNEEARESMWGAPKSGSVTASANQVEADSKNGGCSSCSSCSSSKPPKNVPRNDHNPILNKLGEMQVTLNEVSTFKDKLVKVDSLEQKVQDLERQLSQQRSQYSGRRQFGCDACRAASIGKSCRHCFKCGEDNHRRADCPN